MGKLGIKCDAFTLILFENRGLIQGYPKKRFHASAKFQSLFGLLIVTFLELFMTRLVGCIARGGLNGKVTRGVNKNKISCKGRLDL